MINKKRNAMPRIYNRRVSESPNTHFRRIRVILLTIYPRATNINWLINDSGVFEREETALSRDSKNPRPADNYRLLIVTYSGVTYVHVVRLGLTVLSNERYTCSDVCAIKYVQARAYGIHVCAPLPSRHASERVREWAGRLIGSSRTGFQWASRKKREKRHNIEKENAEGDGRVGGRGGSEDERASKNEREW